MQDNIRKNSISFFILGFNAVVIQLVILRELFSLFFGNELVSGMILACWFVFTGMGALLAKYLAEKVNTFFSYLLLVFPLLLTAVLLLGFAYFKNILFLPGMMQSPFEMLIIIVSVLSPVCILSGGAFPVFAARMTRQRNEIAVVYAVESLGSIVSGVLFSFLLIRFFDSYQIISIIAISNAFFFIAMITLKKKNRNLWVHLLMLLALVVFLMNTDIKNIALGKLYPGQKIIETRENEFGKIVVTGSQEQFNMYLNGTIINSDHNEMATEESVHYIMIQRPESRYVLQVSGNIYNTEKEIKKYHPLHIDFVDINRDIAEMEKKYFSHDTILFSNVYFQDPRIFIRKSPVKYDVVILNTPDPLYAQSNRFYTFEFFSELKRCMQTDAVAGLSLPGMENYMNPSSVQLNSSVYNSLRKVFKNVSIISGNRLFMLASDGNLTLEIAKNITERNIENVYVNEYFLNDSLIKQKSEKIISDINASAPVNYDLKPITYYYGLQHWLSFYQASLWLPVMLVSIIFLVMIFIMKPVNVNLLASGFTSASVEMIIIVAFQSLCGYVYSELSIIITLFMTGLFTGTSVVPKKLKAGFMHFIIMQIILLVFLLIVWVLFNYVLHLSLFVRFVFYLIVFLLALITGVQFVLSTRLKNQPNAINAGNSYSIELLGSAAGALLITSFIIPLLGIPQTLLLLLALNAVVILITIINKKLLGRFA
ncbi:MAG: hypothetical protein M0R16_12845 [Bacteroidales bacterium]|jgi:predicted membrane-bound spermidine synthase|nr:hypothetical protein [Bacteroidales bacterium]